MALPVDGPISFSQILTELRSKRGNIQISMSNARFKRLSGTVTNFIRLGTFRGKSNAPNAPFMTNSGYGSVYLNCNTQARMNVNDGTIMENNSILYHTGTKELKAPVYAYYPGDSNFDDSFASPTITVKILGRPKNVGSDGNRTAEIQNGNTIGVRSYQRSTKYDLTHTNWQNGGNEKFKVEQNPCYPGANSGWAATFKCTTDDGFDSHENYTGRYLNKNTYSWFEADGYIRSALVQHKYEGKWNYGIHNVTHTKPAFVGD